MDAVGQSIRIQVAGMYHVGAHAIAGAPLFADEADFLFRIAQVSESVKKGETRCHAFCLMGTHEHFLLSFEEDRIADVMQQLNRTYAAAFNKRHGRKGHVYDRRYFSSLIRSDAQLLENFRYIALNPEHHRVQRAEDWPWSSYPGLIGLRPQFSFVDSAPITAAFGTGERAAQRARAFVEDGSLRSHVA